MYPVFIRTFLYTVILSLLFFSCSDKPKQGQGAVPVRAGEVQKMNIPVQIKAIGTVEPYITVSIKALVNGKITGVYFKEGQDVNRGQLLFQIDVRPFDAALKQAKAQLERDIAQAKNAKDQAERYRILVEKDYVSRDQYEQLRTNAEAAEALVNADNAAVENARLQVEYCTIRSPIEGRVGNILIDLGNIVKENDLPMLTINKIKPVYVSFSVPEKNLSGIKKHMASGLLRTEAILQGDEKNPAEGRLTFIDNQVDRTTGTIKLKGTFNNTDRKLWPGQFVDVVLTLSVQQDAVVMPSNAIQASQQGSYIFVIKEDMTVERRDIVADRTYNEFSVVTQGAAPGEKVVTDGQIQLVPGTKVEIKEDAGVPENAEAKKDNTAPDADNPDGTEKKK